MGRRTKFRVMTPTVGFHHDLSICLDFALGNWRDGCEVGAIANVDSMLHAIGARFPDRDPVAYLLKWTPSHKRNIVEAIIARKCANNLLENIHGD